MNEPCLNVLDPDFTDLANPDPISIALVADDGCELYPERSGFVRSTVLPSLGAAGALMLPKLRLRVSIDTRLARFIDEQPIVCSDHNVDVALLWKLYGGKSPI